MPKPTAVVGVEDVGKIGIVILNYNNAKDTIACIDCFDDAVGHNMNIFVVDNGSTDESLDRLKTHFASKDGGNIDLLELKENLGYAGGNNIGMREAIQRSCSYICVLNNDTLPKPSELQKLADYLNMHADCAFVGPVLLCDNGNADIIQSAGANIDLWTGNVLPWHCGERRSSLSGSFDCDYIGGACIMFRAADIEALGYIPESYFLYFEETEWCLKARRTGWRVVCNADAAIVHKGSASISQIGGLSSYLLTRNMMRFEIRNARPLQVAYCFVHASCKLIKTAIVHRDGSTAYIGYMLDGLRNVVRAPYRSLVRMIDE